MSSTKRTRVRRREQQRRELAAQWEKNRGDIWSQLLEGRTVGHSSEGPIWPDHNQPRKSQPNLKDWKNPKNLGGEYIEEVLRLAHAVTGDPVFATAATAWQDHALHIGPLKRLLSNRYRYGLAAPVLESYAQMVESRVQAGCTVREAAEIVAATTGIDGASFDAVVDQLRREHRLFRRRSS
jgi:hypothetical protein